MHLPNSERIRLGFRGPSDTKVLNNLYDNVVSDIHAIAANVGVVENRLEQAIRIIIDENRFLKSQVAALKQTKEAENLVRARNGLRITHHQPMYDISNLKLFNITRLKPHIDTLYGIATVPSNGIESKFTRSSIYNGDTIVPLSLDVRVTPIFSDEGTSTPSDHEPDAAAIDPGTPENAFNGVNTSWWVRSVEYPLDSDISEVEVELTVTVPSQNNTFSNVLSIHPYPVGTVDITDISFSADLTSSFSKISHPESPTAANPLTSSRERIFIFPPRDVDQVRVRLRQRNFIEEDGKKVFRYGLQELGLYLIDFEKANSTNSFDTWSQQTNAESISMVHVVNAPENFFFTALNHFSADPDFTLEDSTNRHIIFRVYDGDPTQGSTRELWNSNQTLPQNQPSNVGSRLALAGNVTTLYVVTSMRFVETIAGSNSPYKANTPAYINSFTLEYSASPAF